MKKLFAVLMAMAMVVSMAACAAPAETEAAPSADVEMKYMTADETEAVLGNTDYVIVDVRKAADYAEGHIPGSVSVDMDAAVNGDTAAGEAAMKAAFDGKDSTLILVCYSGKKYAQASTNALSAIGYDMSKVFTLQDGFNNWKEVKADKIEAAATETAAKEVPETSVVRWNYGTSGNILVFIAEEKGYFADEGISLEIVPDTAAGEAAMKAAFDGKDSTLILVCYSGKKYAQASTNALSAIGYDMSKVFTLQDGFNNWKEVKADKIEAAATETAAKEVPETSVVRWNYGTSGNILVFIAEEKGYFADEGISLEIVPATANADAMQLLASNKVDVVSNSGTSNPLQQIASGVDLTVFGGHMVNGCMPVIAKTGTEWKGVESLIGKKFACNPSYFAFTGAVMDLGYDKPLEALEWISYTNYNDAAAAVLKGEVDFALQGTGQNLSASTTEGIEIVCYQSDIMPNYSCCRMVASTDFVKNNPITVKCILKALMRAQADYEANKEEAVKLMAKKIEASEEYVAAYMLNDHYTVSVDPLKNSVIRAWGILDKTGFLSETAKNINIEDHINTDLYEQAMAEAKAEYGAENPDFYAGLESFYAENDK